MVLCFFSIDNDRIVLEKIKENKLFSLDLSDIDGFQQNKKRVKLIVETNVPLKVCEKTKILGFRPTDGSLDHFVFVFNSGDKVKTPLVRSHSQCITGD